ncbi:hypothetical protein ACWKWU_04445 [Chitinophaga lutea]
MGKQVGIIPFTGRVGPLIGYRVGNRYLLRSVPAQVRQTPAMRRSAQDFGKASRLGASLRHALCPQLEARHDNTLVNRLNRSLVNILRQDDLHREKRFIPRYFKDLKGFSLTPYARLWDLMQVTPTVTRENGIQVHVPAMREPSRYKIATHVRMRAIALFTDGRQSFSYASEPMLLNAHTPSQPFTLTIPDEAPGVCCVILEMLPLQQEHGVYYNRLAHRKHVAAEVIAVLVKSGSGDDDKRESMHAGQRPDAIPGNGMQQRSTGPSRDGLLPPAIKRERFHPPPLE